MSLHSLSRRQSMLISLWSIHNMSDNTYLAMLEFCEQILPASTILCRPLRVLTSSLRMAYTSLEKRAGVWGLMSWLAQISSRMVLTSFLLLLSPVVRASCSKTRLALEVTVSVKANQHIVNTNIVIHLAMRF